MKHILFKRGLTGLLTLVLLLGMLLGTVSCAETNDDPQAENTGTGAVADTAEETKAYDTVEKTKYDRDFVIYTREDLLEDFEIEGVTGNVLDDAIFDRNLYVANDFGINYVYYTADSYDTLNENMKLQVNGNLTEYDMYVGHKYSYNACAVAGYCYNLNKITSLDMTAAWWDQGCYENLTVDDKTYMMTGDIIPSSMRISACFTFNKAMMTDLGKSIDELNELAANGNWTLDALLQYSKDVTFDLNGDGTMITRTTASA